MPLTKTQTDLLKELLIATETQSTGDMSKDIDVALKTIVELMNNLDKDSPPINSQEYTPELAATLLERMEELSKNSIYTAAIEKPVDAGWERLAKTALSSYDVPQVIKDDPAKLVKLVRNRDAIFQAVETLKTEHTTALNQVAEEEVTITEDATTPKGDAKTVVQQQYPVGPIPGSVPNKKLTPEKTEITPSNPAEKSMPSIEDIRNSYTLEEATAFVEEVLVSTGAQLRANDLTKAQIIENADGTFNAQDDMALQSAMVFLSNPQYGIGSEGGNDWEFTTEKAQYFIDNYEGSALHKTIEEKKAKGENIESLDAATLTLLAGSLAVLNDNGKLAKEKYDAVPDTLMGMSAMNIEAFLPAIAGIFDLMPFLSFLKPFVQDLVSTLTGEEIDLDDYADTPRNDDIYESTTTYDQATYDQKVYGDRHAYIADDAPGDSAGVVLGEIETPAVVTTSTQSENVTVFNNAATATTSTQQQNTNDATTSTAPAERVFTGALTHDDATAIYLQNKTKILTESAAHASPVIDKDALKEGRVVLTYLDVDSQRELDKNVNKGNALVRVTQSAQKDISDTSRLIKENKAKIDRYTHTGDQENVAKYQAKLPRLEHELFEAKENLRVSKAEILVLQEWLDDPANSPYKTVDVTQEMQNARTMKMDSYDMRPQSGETPITHTARVKETLAAQKENFPNLSKVLEQHENGIYQEIGDIRTLVNFVDSETKYKAPSKDEPSKRTKRLQDQSDDLKENRSQKPSELRTWKDIDRERNVATYLLKSNAKDRIKAQKANKKDAQKDWKKSDNFIEDKKDLQADQAAHAAAVEAAAPDIAKLEKFNKENPDIDKKPKWVKDTEKMKEKLDAQAVELNDRQEELFSDAAENRYIKRTEFKANNENVTGFTVGDKKVDFVVDPQATARI
jgi:hypothetical protein